MTEKSTVLPYLAAIGHRGFSAGANLMLTIVAGRALSAPDFGYFVFGMAVIALLLLPHASFFSEPMLVYGPEKYAQNSRDYLLLLGKAQLGYGLLGGVIAAATGLFFSGQSAFLLFALIVPLVLTLEFQARSFFMQIKPLISFASALIQFTCLGFLFFSEMAPANKTIAGILTPYAIALTAANLFLFGAHFLFIKTRKSKIKISKDIVNIHAEFAKWALLSHLALFVMTDFYILVLPILQDLTTTANFRAQSAIIGAGVQAFAALSLMATPLLRISKDATLFYKNLKRLLLSISLIGLPIFIIIGLWGHTLIQIIYDGKYAILPIGYWIAGLYPLTMGYAFVTSAALRARDEAQMAGMAAGIAALICAPIGLWLTLKFGAEGVIFAQVLGALMMTAICVRALRQRLPG